MSEGVEGGGIDDDDVACGRRRGVISNVPFFFCSLYGD